MSACRANPMTTVPANYLADDSERERLADERAELSAENERLRLERERLARERINSDELRSINNSSKGKLSRLKSILQSGKKR